MATRALDSGTVILMGGEDETLILESFLSF